jgi:hypothetical protein
MFITCENTLTPTLDYTARLIKGEGQTNKKNVEKWRSVSIENLYVDV